MGYSKKYYRDNAKKNREIDKKITELYRSISPNETYTSFKKRTKRDLGY